MADRFEPKPIVTLQATIRLTEPEIRMLYLLASYGSSAVIEALSKHLTSQVSSQLMSTGVHSLIQTARDEFGPMIKQMDAARAVFYDRPAK